MNNDSEKDNSMALICRPSMRVAKAASILEVDISTIYKLVRTEMLEAHRIGKRGVRVYADSLSYYQVQGKITGTKFFTDGPSKNKTQIHGNNLAYQNAIQFLKSHGCMTE